MWFIERTRVVAGPNQPIAVDARQQPLLAQSLNRVRCTLTHILPVDLDGITHLFEYVQENVFFKARQVALACSCVKGHEKAKGKQNGDAASIDRRVVLC